MCLKTLTQWNISKDNCKIIEKIKDRRKEGRRFHVPFNQRLLKRIIKRWEDFRSFPNKRWPLFPEWRKNYEGKLHEIVWQEISFVDFFQLEHLWIYAQMNSKFAVCPFYSKPRLKCIGSWLETNFIDFCHFTHIAFELQLRWMRSWLKTTVIDVYHPDYSTFDIQLILIWSGLDLNIFWFQSIRFVCESWPRRMGSNLFDFHQTLHLVLKFRSVWIKKMFGYCYWFRIAVQILMKLTGENFFYWFWLAGSIWFWMSAHIDRRSIKKQHYWFSTSRPFCLRILKQNHSKFIGNQRYYFPPFWEICLRTSARMNKKVDWKVSILVSVNLSILLSNLIKHS